MGCTLLLDVKRCSICKLDVPIQKFSPTKRNSDGTIKYRASQCTDCRTDAVRKRPKFRHSDTSKECRHCREDKPHGEFSPSVRGKSGISAYCKPCSVEKYRDKERARDATSRYRERHPERWRAAHRLHQFKRRSRIEATADGTVTDAFLKGVYATEICYWCVRYIEPDKRTLEHIVELNDGGEHSASNITMACQPCNSARLGRNK